MSQQNKCAPLSNEQMDRLENPDKYNKASWWHNEKPKDVLATVESAADKDKNLSTLQRENIKKFAKWFLSLDREKIRWAGGGGILHNPDMYPGSSAYEYFNDATFRFNAEFGVAQNKWGGWTGDVYYAVVNKTSVNALNTYLGIQARHGSLPDMIFSKNALNPDNGVRNSIYDARRAFVRSPKAKYNVRTGTFKYIGN